MKVKVKQHKLLELLEKLAFGGMFILSTINVLEEKKKKYFVSVQKLPSAQAIRYLKVSEDYFDTLELTDEPIQVDINRIIKIIKLMPPEKDITLYTKKNKLRIDAGHVSPSLSYRVPDINYKTCPVKNDADIVVYGKTKVPLDTKIEMRLDELKECSGYANAIETEFYQFLTMDNKLVVRVGNLTKMDDYVPVTTNAKVDGKQVRSIFTVGMTEVSQSFSQDKFSMYVATDKPAWLIERGGDYELGVLLAPFIEEK